MPIGLWKVRLHHNDSPKKWGPAKYECYVAAESATLAIEKSKLLAMKDYVATAGWDVFYCEFVAWKIEDGEFCSCG